MGNHEFCSSCGASDFHYGMTCQEAYPEGYARVQKEKQIREAERIKGKILLSKLKKQLKELGVETVSIKSTDFADYIKISGFELARLGFLIDIVVKRDELHTSISKP